MMLKDYSILSKMFSRKHYLLPLILTVLITLPLKSTAQLRPVPLERPEVNSSVKKSGASARTVEPPIDLPFFDDFSSTIIYDGSGTAGIPLTTHWERSENVWINEGIGLNPPSINVATLDGLDAQGKPYSNQVLETGYRDVLMSRAIDLSTAKVSEGDRPGVYLSFQYQWQGNGEAPDNPDFFRVDYLTADSVWVTAATVSTDPEFERDTFYQMILPVSGSQFFHNKFRFRFRNYGKLSGPFDTWNIDYVYLNKGRNENDVTFLDRALTSTLTPVFGPYRGVPLKHFLAAPVFNAPEIDIVNLRPGPDGAPTDYNLQQTIFNYVDGTTIIRSKPFGPIGSKFPDNNLQPGERFHSILRTTVDPIDINGADFTDLFLPDADSIDLRIKVDIYEADNSFFASNDTTSATYYLRDFYAYDDGTAEYAAVLSEPDDQIAYRFDLLTDEPQELVGFDVYIPTYGLSGFTTTNFFVMSSENGEPDVKLTAFTYTIKNKGRDQFQTVLFEPVVVTGQFFIGWRGSASGQLRVGLDFSNTTVDRVYEDINGVTEGGKLKWFPNTGLREGSLMIRPNFGEAGEVTGVRPETKRIALFPNPSRGSFFVDAGVTDIEITTATGSKVPFSSHREEDRTQISVNNPNPGLYILKMRKGKDILTGKVVIY